MQQTTSRLITAVHVWQTNVNFGIGCGPAPLSGGGEKKLLLLHWGKRMCPRTPITQSTPRRTTNTKSAPVPLPGTGYNSSPRQRKRAQRQKMPFSWEAVVLQRGKWLTLKNFPCSLPLLQRTGIVPLDRIYRHCITPSGNLNSPEARFPGPAPRRPSDPVEWTLS